MSAEYKSNNGWTEFDHYVRFMTELVRFERSPGGIWNGRGRYELEDECSIALKVLVCYIISRHGYCS